MFLATSWWAALLHDSAFFSLVFLIVPYCQTERPHGGPSWQKAIFIWFVQFVTLRLIDGMTFGVTMKNNEMCRVTVCSLMHVIQ